MKRAQATIFIIFALIVVAGIVMYFVLRDDSAHGLSENVQPVYDYYLSCVEDIMEQGIAILGAQGGYIQVPDFEPGSVYIPFSSQLDFFGQGVPYWLYISGNNILKEQVPTKEGMESQLENFISERLDSCDFSDFEEQGYNIYIGKGDVDVSIDKFEVSADIQNEVIIFSGNHSFAVSDHSVSIESKLGNFYDLAIQVYNYEKESVFLEHYALDVMRLYAPVDGVEMGCAPKIFVDEEIREDLYAGLEANMNAIRLEEDSSKENEYFIVDSGIAVDENVNFLYDSSWSSRIEIYGDRVVKPVGTQQGLSMLGFCYVPYHLVYDIYFPVMIQFFDETELFQFPVSVIIDNSAPRESLNATFESMDLESEICRYQNANITVYTYDYELNPVEANLQFKCFDSACLIGETELEDGEAVFEGNAPQCVNGFIVASTDGYADSKYKISTNSESVANILMKKEYSLNLDLGAIEGTAVVNFVGEDYSSTIIYPETKKVDLIEGYYNVTV